MSTPRTWLGISNREWLINSNTRQVLVDPALTDQAAWGAVGVGAAVVELA